MSNIRERIVHALAQEVDDDTGWLSDAQHAQLEYDELNNSIRFCGEGSIDLGHLASLVMLEIEKPEPKRPYEELMWERDEAEAKEGIFDY